MKKEKLNLTLNYFNLDSLLKELDKLKIDKKDYSKLKFELNWDNCYYEGDWPEIYLVESK